MVELSWTCLWVAATPCHWPYTAAGSDANTFIKVSWLVWGFGEGRLSSFIPTIPSAGKFFEQTNSRNDDGPIDPLTIFAKANKPSGYTCTLPQHVITALSQCLYCSKVQSIATRTTTTMLFLQERISDGFLPYPSSNSRVRCRISVSFSRK